MKEAQRRIVRRLGSSQVAVRKKILKVAAGIASKYENDDELVACVGQMESSLTRIDKLLV